MYYSKTVRIQIKFAHKKKITWEQISAYKTKLMGKFTF